MCFVNTSPALEDEAQLHMDGSSGHTVDREWTEWMEDRNTMNWACGGTTTAEISTQHSESCWQKRHILPAINLYFEIRIPIILSKLKLHELTGL